ncbi:ERG2/sigma1 receptor-like protein [Corchorus capsularis]|uniref:ERG2/sigma1 receptor-like protein n=1 Tax=Corchorus capsularis TaxID=210143 RepID=A0A1R3G111_COCAP|nr:ERG2/sigma1 receptor-like protein [Corchorus capsularis]
MKPQLSATASSSVRSTTTTMEDDRGENRDSCYYPGCRKDANCNCEICLASINATLDLMPASVQKSSFTKLSASKPKLDRTPISFDSGLSTPRSISSRLVQESPALKSTARVSFKEKKEKERKNKGDFQSLFWKIFLGLSLVFGMEIGFSWVFYGVLRPTLTRDLVRSIGERALVVQDLKGKLRFLQNELRGFANGKVSNCSNSASIWEIDQGGSLLNSHCVLYKSAMEEVRIWGWPLQTAGLLTTGFSSRSFTILSGRVTEWSNGKVGFKTRKGNASWVQRRWGSSVIQLDPNTWIIEYRQNSIVENPRLFSATLELLRNRLTRIMTKITREFWLFSAFEDLYSASARNEHLKIPT